jgi:hypothetical protein
VCKFFTLSELRLGVSIVASGKTARKTRCYHVIEANFPFSLCFLGVQAHFTAFQMLDAIVAKPD